VDEAASALRLAQESKPDGLERLGREVMTLQIELESLRNETDVFSVERRGEVERLLDEKRKEERRLDEMWQAERSRLKAIKETKAELEKAKHDLEIAQREMKFDQASRLRYSVIPELESKLPSEDKVADPHHDGQAEELTMLHDRVTSGDIARVVAKTTGIPVQSLLKGEREKLTHVRTEEVRVSSSLMEFLDGGCPTRTYCWTGPRC